MVYNTSTTTTTTNREATRENRTNENDGRFLKFIRRTHPCSVLCIFGLGIVFLIVGLVVNVFLRDIFTQQNIDRLPLSSDNNSEITKLWLSQKIPQHLKVYMFNWTNPDESIAGSEIPNFVELGPYVFRARVFKEDVEWNDNFTISYLQKRRWDFVPDQSNGSLSDQVTSINIAAVALAYQLEHFSFSFVVNNFNDVVNSKGVRLVIRESVQNQLFQGYNDGVLSVLKTVRNLFDPDLMQTFSNCNDIFVNFKNIFTSSSTPNKTEPQSIPSQIVDRLRKLDTIKEEFAYWYKKNHTEAQHFNIHTGADDINRLGDVHSWNFNNKCRNTQEMQGSLGELWPMESGKRDRISIFVPDMCSSFDLIKAGPIEIDGVEGMKFVGTTETMGPSASRKPGTYVDPDHLTGIRNITSIVNGPVFISFPHFYEASKEYRTNISGMNPNKTKHEFVFVLQKDAGVVLQVQGRFQVNILVEPSSKIDILSKFPTVFFPTIWFEQTAEIPPEVLHEIQFGFTTMPRILAGIGLASIIIAIMFLASAFVVLLLLHKSKAHSTAAKYFDFSMFKSKSPKMKFKDRRNPKTNETDQTVRKYVKIPCADGVREGSLLESEGNVQILIRDD